MATIINQRLATLRCLLIDDMAQARQTMRIQLGEIGLTHVAQASTPNEALQQLAKHDFDVIICDYNLNCPTADGQQLLEHLRAQNLLRPTTIFMMVTGETGYSQVASAAEFQPDAYLVKPITGGMVLSRLERLLDKQASLLPLLKCLSVKDMKGVVREADAVLMPEHKWWFDIQRHKAQALLELNEPDAACKLYEAVLQQRSDTVWAQMGLARCHMLTDRYEDARKVTSSLLASNDRYIPAYDLLARIDEAQGQEQAALDRLRQSYEVVPSARRSRMLADLAYRTGHLEEARQAYERTMRQCSGSMMAQATDSLSLAQVHIDQGNSDLAKELLAKTKALPGKFPQFDSVRNALLCQAHLNLGELDEASAAYESAKQQCNHQACEPLLLAMAKAAFQIGKDDEGKAWLTDAVMKDHECQRLVSLAKKVLADTGKESLGAGIVDHAQQMVQQLINDAKALMKQAKFTEALEKIDLACQRMPDNTQVLLEATQLYLLWLSIKGMRPDFLVKINQNLKRLDQLLPNHERVIKMRAYMRDTLAKVAEKAMA